MRQPLALGCRPEASSNAPAWASCSWYSAIAAKTLSLSGGKAPASVIGVALTMIMNRMVVSPSGWRVAEQQAPDARRTRGQEFDTIGPRMLLAYANEVKAMMKTRSLFFVIAALAGIAAALAATTPAAERCEAAVRDTSAAVRGRAAHDVRFVAAKRALAPPAHHATAVPGDGPS